MNNYQSIATINAPEFINLEPLDINPMMSKCEIKVLYLGENRNGTSINKEAASEMAKTLRGAPIVGYYREHQQDFFDHGEQIIYDGEGVHFNTLTKPYGFVSPDADVWFQEFEEFNEAGESTTRVYLMTTGYLWTGQFKEAQQIFNEGGKPQSMELDENSLQGFWSKGENSDIEFFIINDAVFSKLCILGDDVEPCFEGASITAPNISKTFTLDEKFTRTLYTMMKELQETLQGGNYKVADEIKKKSVDSASDIQEEIVETPTEPVEPVEEPTDPSNGSSADTPEENPSNEINTPDSEAEGSDGDGDSSGTDDGGDGGEGSSDYVKKDDEEEGKSTDDEAKEEEKEANDKEDDDDEEDTKKKYSLLLVQFEELQQSFNELQSKQQETEKLLEQYKSYALAAELEKKDALIAEFYMLSDEDKKDVIDHKAEYTLDEIKSKLAVLCYDKKVNYTKPDEKSEEITTVNIDSYVANNVPDWLQAVENYKNQKEEN